MDRTANHNVGQSKASAPVNKINGEKVVQQLEELLDSYESLDEGTLKALERAFGTYKNLRPSVLNEVTSYVSGGMSNIGGKIAALGKKNTADEKKNAGAAWGKSKLPQEPKKPAGKQSGKTAFSGTFTDDVVKKLEDYAKTVSQDCLVAEKAYAEARARYEYQKRVLAVYEETVEPFVEPFKKVMENLVYFAACADPAVYEEGKTPLRNKSRALRNGMQPGMWGEYLDAAHLNRIGEMFEVDSPAAPFSFQAESEADVNARIAAYKRRIEAANDQRKPYDTENAKLANRIKQAQLLWEYVDLLRCFLPQLENITGISEEEESVRWATEIGEALLAEVKNHTCRNSKMRFLWVYPHGEISRRSEKIRVQFIAAELDCPGLYYSFAEDHDGLKRFGCVFPGCSKE